MGSSLPTSITPIVPQAFHLVGVKYLHPLPVGLRLGDSLALLRSARERESRPASVVVPSYIAIYPALGIGNPERG